MGVRLTPAPFGREPDDPLVEILHIEGDLSDELALSRPVRVEVWLESGEFVADIAEFNVHAFGATSDEAIVNLRDQIVEQQQRFLKLRDRLSPAMQRDAEMMEAAIQ